MKIPQLNSDIVRTHDNFYLDIDPHAPPKESFIQVGDLISNWIGEKSEVLTIADIGCATGAFLNYLHSRFQKHNLVGYEYLESLVGAGQKNYPYIKIRQGSISDRGIIAPASIDVLTLLGVISIFDDIEPLIKNFSLWIKPGGRLLVHGMFNPLDVDVFVKYRASVDHNSGPYQAGWNIISQKTVSTLLLKYGAKRIHFHEFKMSVDLEGDPHDPLRSWTEKLSDGNRQIVNATCLKQPQYVLEADF
jgi:SAM-dependent methyltransferase